MAEDRARRASFGEAVQYRRKMLGLTQGDVARLMHVSQNTVSRWEVAAHPPDNPLVVEQLARLLHADLDDLRQGIIHTSRPSEDLHGQVMSILMGHIDSPEVLALLGAIVEKSLHTNLDGLRRIDDYVSLIAERYPKAGRELIPDKGAAETGQL
jgi:transcriptional regulator with XRE-family HTH domain